MIVTLIVKNPCIMIVTLLVTSPCIMIVTLLVKGSLYSDGYGTRIDKPRNI